MKKGVWFVFASYVLWGFFPIYFKTLHVVSAFQIVAHRFIWSFLFLLLLVVLRREVGALKAAIKPRILLIYLGAGAVLAVNWTTYVWSVNNGYLVEASLGYFINPLVSVLLGIVFLREKLRPAQWLPVGIAAAGVVFLTVSYGGLPWVSLVLALSFGLYGLIKKTAPLGSLHGLTIETAMLILPAIGFLLYSEANGTGDFGHMGLTISLLLAFTGVVTAIPLLLFAAGTPKVPLSTVGLLQYVSPTLQFITGVFIFREAFSREHLIGFCIIWLALILFSAESLISRRRSAAAAAPTAISS